MSMSNVISISINIMDMKMHMSNLPFYIHVGMLVSNEKDKIVIKIRDQIVEGV
jgi:hypothetical protein